MIPKPVRTKDRKFLDTFHEKRCVNHKDKYAEPAHIKSKGAFGGDDWFNIIAFCRQCHQTQHSKGWAYMIEKYPATKLDLESKGWQLDERKRLIRG